MSWERFTIFLLKTVIMKKLVSALLAAAALLPTSISAQAAETVNVNDISVRYC